MFVSDMNINPEASLGTAGCVTSMNDSESMANAMRIGICSSISFETRGIDRFMIHTGFSFPDDDELHIILKRRDGG